jgi:hypothetical protein
MALFLLKYAIVLDAANLRSTIMKDFCAPFKGINLGLLLWHVACAMSVAPNGGSLMLPFNRYPGFSALCYLQHKECFDTVRILHVILQLVGDASWEID